MIKCSLKGFKKVECKLFANDRPIKFATWHTYSYPITGSNMQIAIQERSRSCKAIFALQRYPNASFTVDNGASFWDTARAASTLQQYQFRIGARYFPAAPVQGAVNSGSSVSNGGCEAYVELEKALNMVGDYRLSTSNNVNRWALGSQQSGSAYTLNWYDYGYQIKSFDADGFPIYNGVEGGTSSSFGTFIGSQCFGMAIDLETSNGIEISGLNAEEQSDISILCQWTAAQQMGSAQLTPNLEVFVYFDKMVILRENNIMEIVE